VARRAGRPLVRYLLVLTVPVLLVAAGTLGYTMVEGWDGFDSLYMTVTTLTTVGFGEIHPLSRGGRTFTILLILGGVFTLFYTATEFIRAVVSGEVQRVFGRQRMERTLAELKDHIIVCGYGRMGRFVCREFSAAGLKFVVIDRQSALLEGFDLPHGIPLHGEATSDDVLKSAGVARARALLTLAASDADNLYITMSARLLNEKLFIVARSDSEPAEVKLVRAGASRVILPYVIGGQRVAQAVLRPSVMDFIELATRSEHMELQIEQTEVQGGGSLAGRTLRDSGIRQELGVIIVAIKKPDGTMVFNPDGAVAMTPGDVLITLGHRQQLDRLETLATGRER
jgi:voltage-gated potassium channel